MPRPKKEPSKPLSELPLVEQIDAILANNGGVSQDTKDKLMFSVVKTLIININDIQVGIEDIKERNRITDDRMEVLERRNVVTWAIKNPALATVIFVSFIFLLFSHYGNLLLNALGIKLP